MTTVGNNRPQGDAGFREAADQAIRHSFLRQFPQRLMAELESDALRIDIPAGSELFHEQDEPRSSLVVWGLVRVFMFDPHGRDVSVRYARPGDVIGIAAIFGGPAPLHVRMITDATLLMFNARTMERLAKTSPGVAWVLAQEVTRRYYDALEIISGDAPGSVRRRVARYLLETASLQRGQTVVSPVTRQELAHATGAAPPTVTRVLRDLRTKGLIGSGSGGILLLDPEGLYVEALEVHA